MFFVKDEDVIDVKVFCRKIGHRYVSRTEKEFGKLEEKEEDKKKYECLSAKMRELTWELYNDLQESALVSDGDGERQFNFKLYKENRIMQLLKEWDAKNDDGKPIPINKVSIAHLAPSVAEAILRAYDEISFISEEEEGK